jgi:hypothetical protein
MLSHEDFIEAHRIAGELEKVHRAGGLTGARDPAASKLAQALRIFEATFAGIDPPDNAAPLPEQEGAFVSHCPP